MQCVKASACNCNSSKKTLKKSWEKVTIQTNPIHIDDALMFCTFWYLYTRVNFLVCNQSTKAFTHYSSLCSLSIKSKVICDYTEFGTIEQTHLHCFTQDYLKKLWWLSRINSHFMVSPDFICTCKHVSTKNTWR